MKKLLITLAACVTLFAGNAVYGAFTVTCQSFDFYTNITGGIRIETRYPLCSSCDNSGVGQTATPCCSFNDEELCTSYRCTCNAGYHAVNQGTSTCSCECTNTCSSSGFTPCTIVFGSGVKANTGGNSCTTGCTYGACTPTRCDSGYYKDGNSCTRCPTTLPTGWTGVSNVVFASKNNGMNGSSDCYVTGKFRNASGEFEISGTTNCVY